MKTALLFLLLLASGTLRAQADYTQRLLLERSEKETAFRKEVLNETEAAAFQGICYFEIDSTYVVAATFQRKKGKKFAMPMTKERLVYYRQYGTLTFTIHDTLCTLKVYENLSLKGNKEYKDYLFLPFRDGTTAISTYGGGRYLDIQKSSASVWMIDFNRAYHPYCVYSERYSCPIPPKENVVAPMIEAGECYTPHD